MHKQLFASDSDNCQTIPNVLYYPENKIISIFDEINEETVKLIWAIFVSGGCEVRGIVINSTGGSLLDANAIVDIIGNRQITTIALGKVFSAAAYIYAVGKKRFAFNNTTFMIHSGSITHYGEVQFSQSQAMNEMWAKEVPTMLDTILKATNIKNKQKLKNDLMNGIDLYWSVEDALQNGFVHGVVNIKDIMKYGKSKHSS